MNSADQGHPDPVCDDDGDLRENVSVSRCQPAFIPGLPVFCQYEVRRQSNFSTLGVGGRRRVKLGNYQFYIDQSIIKFLLLHVGKIFQSSGENKCAAMIQGVPKKTPLCV